MAGVGTIIERAGGEWRNGTKEKEDWAQKQSKEGTPSGIQSLKMIKQVQMTGKIARKDGVRACEARSRRMLQR